MHTHIKCHARYYGAARHSAMRHGTVQCAPACRSASRHAAPRRATPSLGAMPLLRAIANGCLRLQMDATQHHATPQCDKARHRYTQLPKQLRCKVRIHARVGESTQTNVLDTHLVRGQTASIDTRDLYGGTIPDAEGFSVGR